MAIKSTFTYDSNFSKVFADLKNLAREATAVNSVFSQLNKSAGAAKMAAAQVFAGQAGAAGFHAQMVNLNGATENFGQQLMKNKLTMREYFREASVAYRKDSKARILAEREVRRAQGIVVGMGDIGGQRKGMLLTPQTIDMKNAANRMAVANKQYEIFNHLVNRGATELVNWGKNTQWAGRQLTVGLTVPMAIFTGQAMKAFAELDSQITRFKKVYGSDLTGSVGDATDKMIAEIRGLGSEFAKEFGIASKETMALAADLAATGLEGESLANAVRQTTRMIVLGEVDRQQAMQATLSIQTAFNQNSRELAKSIDFLNAVENSTSASLQDLTEAIPKTGPVIQALGGDIKDLSILMTALREGGISAGEGANAIKAGMASLIAPTKQAIDVARQFGIDLEGVVKRNKGELMPLLLDFQNQLRGLDDFGKARIIEQIFGKYQFARISALFDNLNQQGSQTVGMVKLLDASADDLAKKSYAELQAQAEAPSTRLAAAQQQLTENLIKIGADLAETLLPIFDKALGFLGTLINAFNNLPGPVKNFAKIIAGVAVAAGPILMLAGIFGNLIGNTIKFGMSIINLFKRITGNPVQQLTILTDQEMAAKLAADQLTGAYHKQKISVDMLNKSLQLYIANLRAATTVAPPGAVIPGMRGGPPAPSPLRRQEGGTIYAKNGVNSAGRINGYGGGDTVPALLEQGEFVINKKSSAKYAPLLRDINAGKNIPGYSRGYTDGPYKGDTSTGKTLKSYQESPVNYMKNVLAQERLENPNNIIFKVTPTRDQVAEVLARYGLDTTNEKVRYAIDSVIGDLDRAHVDKFKSLVFTEGVELPIQGKNADFRFFGVNEGTQSWKFSDAATNEKVLKFLSDNKIDLSTPEGRALISPDSELGSKLIKEIFGDERTGRTLQIRGNSSFAVASLLKEFGIVTTAESAGYNRTLNTLDQIMKTDKGAKAFVDALNKYGSVNPPYTVESLRNLLGSSEALFNSTEHQRLINNLDIALQKEMTEDTKAISKGGRYLATNEKVSTDDWRKISKEKLGFDLPVKNGQIDTAAIKNNQAMKQQLIDLGLMTESEKMQWTTIKGAIEEVTKPVLQQGLLIKDKGLGAAKLQWWGETVAYNKNIQALSPDEIDELRRSSYKLSMETAMTPENLRKYIDEAAAEDKAILQSKTATAEEKQLAKSRLLDLAKKKARTASDVLSVGKATAGSPLPKFTALFDGYGLNQEEIRAIAIEEQRQRDISEASLIEMTQDERERQISARRATIPEDVIARSSLNGFVEDFVAITKSGVLQGTDLNKKVYIERFGRSLTRQEAGEILAKNNTAFTGIETFFGNTEQEIYDLLRKISPEIVGQERMRLAEQIANGFVAGGSATITEGYTYATGSATRNFANKFGITSDGVIERIKLFTQKRFPWMFNKGGQVPTAEHFRQMNVPGFMAGFVKTFLTPSELKKLSYVEGLVAKGVPLKPDQKAILTKRDKVKEAKEAKAIEDAKTKADYKAKADRGEGEFIDLPGNGFKYIPNPSVQEQRRRMAEQKYGVGTAGKMPEAVKAYLRDGMGIDGLAGVLTPKAFKEISSIMTPLAADEQVFTGLMTSRAQREALARGEAFDMSKIKPNEVLSFTKNREVAEQFAMDRFGPAGSQWKQTTRQIFGKPKGMVQGPKTFEQRKRWLRRDLNRHIKKLESRGVPLNDIYNNSETKSYLNALRMIDEGWQPTVFGGPLKAGTPAADVSKLYGTRLGNQVTEEELMVILQNLSGGKQTSFSRSNGVNQIGVSGMKNGGIVGAMKAMNVPQMMFGGFPPIFAGAGEASKMIQSYFTGKNLMMKPPLFADKILKQITSGFGSVTKISGVYENILTRAKTFVKFMREPEWAAKEQLSNKVTNFLFPGMAPDSALGVAGGMPYLESAMQDLIPITANNLAEFRLTPEDVSQAWMASTFQRNRDLKADNIMINKKTGKIVIIDPGQGTFGVRATPAGGMVNSLDEIIPADEFMRGIVGAANVSRQQKHAGNIIGEVFSRAGVTKEQALAIHLKELDRLGKITKEEFMAGIAGTERGRQFDETKQLALRLSNNATDDLAEVMWKQFQDDLGILRLSADDIMEQAFTGQIKYTKTGKRAKVPETTIQARTAASFINDPLPPLEIPQAKSRSLYTFWGRTNPPTVGHESVIRSQKALADESGSDFLFGISKSERDPKKNPFTWDEKRVMFEKLMPDLAPFLLTHPGAKDMSDLIVAAGKAGYKELNIAVGEDRSDLFTRLIPLADSHGVKLKVTVYPRPEGAVSATMTREAIAAGDVDAVASLLGGEAMSPELRRQVAQDVIDTWKTKSVKLQSGGIIYAKNGVDSAGKINGYGGGDRIPALLEQGEFVINKKSSAKYAGLLRDINRDTLPGFTDGVTGPQPLNANSPQSKLAKAQGRYQGLGGTMGMAMGVMFLPMMMQMAGEMEGFTGLLIKAGVAFQLLIIAVQAAAAVQSLVAKRQIAIQTANAASAAFGPAAGGTGAAAAAAAKNAGGGFIAQAMARGGLIGGLATALGPLAVIAATVGVFYALYKFNESKKEERARQAAAGTKEAKEGAKLYNIRLETMDKAMQKRQAQSLAAGNREETGITTVDKVVRSAVNKDFADAIVFLKDLESQQSKVNELTRIYSSLRTQGFSTKQAKEYTQEIARQAGVADAWGKAWENSASKIKNAEQAMGAMVREALQNAPTLAPSQIEAQFVTMFERLVSRSGDYAIQAGAQITELLVQGMASKKSIEDSLAKLEYGPESLINRFIQNNLDPKNKKDAKTIALLIRGLLAGFKPKDLVEAAQKQVKDEAGKTTTELELKFEPKIAMDEIQIDANNEINKILRDTIKELEAQQEKVNKFYDKRIDLVEKEKQALQNAHEKKMEMLDEEADKLQDRADLINKNADLYIKALEKEYRAEEFYNNRRKTGLEGLSSLAKGDVFGFVQAQIQQASDASQFGREQAIEQIQNTRDAALAGIEAQLKANQDAKEAAGKALEDQMDALDKRIENLNTKRSKANKKFQDEIDKIQEVIDLPYAEKTLQAFQDIQAGGAELAEVLPKKFQEAVGALTIGVVEDFDNAIAAATQKIATKYGIEESEAQQMYLDIIRGVQNIKSGGSTTAESPGFGDIKIIVKKNKNENKEYYRGYYKKYNKDTGKFDVYKRDQIYPVMNGIADNTFIILASGERVNIKNIPQRKNKGGMILKLGGGSQSVVPGPNVNRDVVPAMLTPGEFVMTREATRNNLPALQAMNAGYNMGGKVMGYGMGGKVMGYNRGGMVGRSPVSIGTSMPSYSMPSSPVGSVASVVQPQVNKNNMTTMNMNFDIRTNDPEQAAYMTARDVKRVMRATSQNRII